MSNPTLDERIEAIVGPLQDTIEGEFCTSTQHNRVCVEASEADGKIKQLIRDVALAVIGEDVPVECNCGSWSCEDWSYTGGVNAFRDGMRDKAKELLGD